MYASQQLNGAVISGQAQGAWVDAERTSPPEHLERAGWRIVARNYRVREGEIDLIATRGSTLAFCEVKTLVQRAQRVARAGESDRVGRLSEADARAAHGAHVAGGARG